MGAAELRHAALLARRRARPAHRRRELVAQLRRRSRDVLELPDPGPVLCSSLEHGEKIYMYVGHGVMHE